MVDFYQELPKAELHLHLEGSVEPATLAELAPELSPDEIASVYQFSGFQGFLQAFTRVVQRLRTPEDYALVTRRMIERMQAQNVRYAEVTLSAGVVYWKKQEFEPVFDAIRAAAHAHPVEVRWILDTVRHFGVEPAMRVAEIAARYVDDGVVAFGIGGDEARGPAEWFGEVYRFAREKGLRLTAHAGESMGPESVWAALEIGAERIGHGVRAIEDPVLLRHLRDHNVPLEVCITSNVVTGVVNSLRDHPVRKLYEAGVPLVFDTDDPAFFGTTLCKEYELAETVFGFSRDELRRIAENGFRYAFDVEPG